MKKKKKKKERGLNLVIYFFLGKANEFINEWFSTRNAKITTSANLVIYY
jgi:hypothetical protein